MDSLDDELPLTLNTATVAFVDVAESVRLVCNGELQGVQRIRGLLTRAALDTVPRFHGRVIEAANRLAVGAQAPTLVANLSYGGNAGAHDGTGLLESAMQGEFTLLVPPDKQFETYLELWFSCPGADPHTAQWLQPGEVVLRATGPDGLVMEAGFPDAVFSQGTLPQSVAGLVCLPKVSQSRHRSMALLVTAATQSNSRRVESPAGRWTVQVTHTGLTHRHLQVDAWVERDDTTVGAVRPQAARLVANADGQCTHLVDADTLSHRRLHPQMVTAGALLNRDTGSGHPSVSAYSAAGLDDHSGPGFSALVDSHPDWPGMPVMGSHSGQVTRADGTSLAAPQVARWLANRLAAGQALPAILAEPAPGRTARRGRFVP